MHFDAAQQAEFVGQIARHQAALHSYIISLMPGMDGVSDVLQETIAESGLSLYRISLDTGVVKTSLMRFMRGETSLRLDKADALAEYFGLELVKRTRKRR